MSFIAAGEILGAAATVRTLTIPGVRSPIGRQVQTRLCILDQAPVVIAARCKARCGLVRLAPTQRLSDQAAMTKGSKQPPPDPGPAQPESARPRQLAPAEGLNG